MNQLPPVMRPASARLWHLLTVIVCGAAVLAQTYLVIIGSVDVNSGVDTSPKPLPVRLTNLLSFFTIQSNILVLISTVRLLVDPALATGRRGSIWWQVVRVDALLGIIVTGLVYAVALAPLLNPTGGFALVNAGLHYLTPLLAPIGWLVFGPRPRIDRRVLGLALIWPIAWVIYTLVRGAVTGWYPYPFLAVPVIGWGRTVINIGGVVVLSLLLLVILRIVDRGLPATAP